MPGPILTRPVALPSPRGTPGRKASQEASSRKPGRPAGPRAGRAKRSRPDGDRGAGSAEIVIAVPLLMLPILLIIQFAVWEQAESIAHATAGEALAAARVQGGTAAAGQQRAAQVISQIGSGVLTSPRVSVAMTAADVTVRVTGTTERVLPVPGLRFAVTATVTGPVERFVPDSPAQG